MPVYKLVPQWVKVAAAGTNAQLTNIGQVDIDIAKGTPGAATSKLVPHGSMATTDVKADIYARALEPKAELLTTITPAFAG